MQPVLIGSMADQTAGIARAAVPGGNAYVRMRDELESLVEDPELAHVFPRRGQAAEHPWDLESTTSRQNSQRLAGVRLGPL